MTKQCSNCKEIKELNQFSKNCNAYGGYKSRCKKCTNEYYLLRKDKIKEDRLSNREVYLLKQYIRTDKRRGQVCDLTVKWLKEHITSKSCTYCEDTEHIGCDRIDNNISHTMSNCIPCCGNCNMIRRHVYSVAEMLRIGKLLRQIREEKHGQTKNS